MNINKYKIKIGSIDFNNNNFTILSDNQEIFESKIIKGSVDFKIFNEHDQEVNLSNLESGDLVQIIGITNPDDKPLTNPDDKPLTNPDDKQLTNPKYQPLIKSNDKPLTNPKYQPLKPEEKKHVNELLKLIGETNINIKNNNLIKSKSVQKNSIIIKKIIIKNKYVFNSESSEEFDSYDWHKF